MDSDKDKSLEKESSPNSINESSPEKAIQEEITHALEGVDLEIPDEKKGEVINKVSQFVSSLIISTFRGPVPPADLLGDYDKIIVKGAERLFSGHEKERKHRHISKRIDQGTVVFGMLCALIIVCTLLFVGFKLTMAGHDVVGGIIFGTAVVAFAGAFIIKSYIGSKKQ